MTRSNEISALLELTRDMLFCAERGDWERMQELESSRAGRLQNCFGGNLVAADIESLSSGIQEMLTLNERIIALIKQARDATACELRQIGRGRKAVDAYASHKR